jgi:hypothetical protein
MGVAKRINPMNEISAEADATSGQFTRREGLKLVGAGMVAAVLAHTSRAESESSQCSLIEGKRR